MLVWWVYLCSKLNSKLLLLGRYAGFLAFSMYLGRLGGRYEIKTHGSVLCGPRSRCTTPVSILTARTKLNFRTCVALYCLDETRRFLLWTRPPPSVLHIPNLSKIASSVPEICDFKNWLSFFVFSSYFTSFRTLAKTAIKR